MACRVVYMRRSSRRDAESGLSWGVLLTMAMRFGSDFSLFGTGASSLMKKTSDAVHAGRAIRPTRQPLHSAPSMLADLYHAAVRPRAHCRLPTTRGSFIYPCNRRGTRFTLVAQPLCGDAHSQPERTLGVEPRARRCSARPSPRREAVDEPFARSGRRAPHTPREQTERRMQRESARRAEIERMRVQLEPSRHLGAQSSAVRCAASCSSPCTIFGGSVRREEKGDGIVAAQNLRRRRAR